MRAANLRLGRLYDFIYDTLRKRGTPPDSETALWACLLRLKDPKTGEIGLTRLDWNT